MSAGPVHALERLSEAGELRPFGLLAQHFGKADDRVEGQLMAHIGEELRLVPARNLESAALLLDLTEQPRVLYRQNRLGGKGLQEVGRGFWKESRFPPPHYEKANDAVRP